MRTTLAILLLYFLSSGSNAQVQNVNITGSYNGVFMLSNTGSDYKINGSPYLSEDWMYGTLEMKSEIAAEIDTIHEITGLFRYNLYGQEFEMIHNKDTFAIIAPFDIQEVFRINFVNSLR